MDGLNAMPTSRPDFTGPLFVVGFPRSGTKLLRTLLSNHSQISILRIESEFLPYLAHKWESFGDLSDRRAFRRFHRRVLAFPYFLLQSWEGDPAIDADLWYDTCRSYTPAGVFEALARHDAGVAFGSRGIWGDKSPTYVRHIPLLKRLYPYARIVHIIRDVRDQAVSAHKAWGKNMFRAAQRWADGVPQARADGARLGRNYLELRYEDLIGAPQRELARICAFLGVAFEPGMDRLAEPSEDLGDARGRTEILRGNSGKWRQTLQPHEIRRIEAIACRTLRDCGYPVGHDVRPERISSLSMLAYQGLDAINLLRTNQGYRRNPLRFHFNSYRIAGHWLK